MNNNIHKAVRPNSTLPKLVMLNSAILLGLMLFTGNANAIYFREGGDLANTGKGKPLKVKPGERILSIRSESSSSSSCGVTPVENWLEKMTAPNFNEYSHYRDFNVTTRLNGEYRFTAPEEPGVYRLRAYIHSGTPWCKSEDTYSSEAWFEVGVNTNASEIKLNATKENNTPLGLKYDTVKLFAHGDNEFGIDISKPPIVVELTHIPYDWYKKEHRILLTPVATEVGKFPYDQITTCKYKMNPQYEWKDIEKLKGDTSHLLDRKQTDRDYTGKTSEAQFGHTDGEILPQFLTPGNIVFVQANCIMEPKSKKYVQRRVKTTNTQYFVRNKASYGTPKLYINDLAVSSQSFDYKYRGSYTLSVKPEVSSEAVSSWDYCTVYEKNDKSDDEPLGDIYLDTSGGHNKAISIKAQDLSVGTHTYTATCHADNEKLYTGEVTLTRNSEKPPINVGANFKGTKVDDPGNIDIVQPGQKIILPVTIKLTGNSQEKSYMFTLETKVLESLRCPDSFRRWSKYTCDNKFSKPVDETSEWVIRVPQNIMQQSSDKILAQYEYENKNGHMLDLLKKDIKIMPEVNLISTGITLDEKVKEAVYHSGSKVNLNVSYPYEGRSSGKYLDPQYINLLNTPSLSIDHLAIKLSDGLSAGDMANAKISNNIPVNKEWTGNTKEEFSSKTSIVISKETGKLTMSIPIEIKAVKAGTAVVEISSQFDSKDVTIKDQIDPKEVNILIGDALLPASKVFEVDTNPKSTIDLSPQSKKQNLTIKFKSLKETGDVSKSQLSIDLPKGMERNGSAIKLTCQPLVADNCGTTLDNTWDGGTKNVLISEVNLHPKTAYILTVPVKAESPATNESTLKEGITVSMFQSQLVNQNTAERIVDYKDNSVDKVTQVKPVKVINRGTLTAEVVKAVDQQVNPPVDGAKRTFVLSLGIINATSSDTAKVVDSNGKEYALKAFGVPDAKGVLTFKSESIPIPDTLEYALKLSVSSSGSVILTKFIVGNEKGTINVEPRIIQFNKPLVKFSWGDGTSEALAIPVETNDAWLKYSVYSQGNFLDSKTLTVLDKIKNKKLSKSNSWVNSKSFAGNKNNPVVNINKSWNDTGLLKSGAVMPIKGSIKFRLK